MEDLPSASAGGFGAPGRVWFGNRRGLKVYAPEALDGDVQAQLPRLLDAFRKQSTGTFALRSADGRAAPTREEFQATTALQRELDRRSLKLQDLSQATLELAGRLGPSTGDSPQTLAEVLKPPVPPSVITAAPAATGNATAAPTRLTAPAGRPLPP